MRRADAEFRWIIDPIDGTKSYVRGVPIWATLIGLEHDGELVVGVASAPALGSRWWAGRGLGAFRDGEPIARVGGRRARRRADLVRVGHDGAVRRRRHRRQACSTLAHECWRMRGVGDFWQHVLVAEGAFDIAIDPIVALWDIAALVPIIEEAGGRWSTLDGRADVERRQLRVHQRPAARRRVDRAHSRDARDRRRMCHERHRRDRHRHVVGEGGRRRRRRQRRRPVAHPARRSTCPTPATVRARRARRLARRSARALDALGSTIDAARASSVAAMVPSLTAVDADGRPIAPGLLYGDERGHGDRRRAVQPSAASSAVPALAARTQSRRARLLDGAEPSRTTRCPARPVISTTVAATRAGRCSTRARGTRSCSPSAARASSRCRRSCRRAQRAGEVIGHARLRARRRHDRRDGRADRRRRRQRRRRARDLRHDAHRVGVVAEPVDIPGYYPIPHTTPRHVPRRRAEQRGRAVPQLGDVAARRRRRRAATLDPRTCRSGCRTRAANACRSTIPTGAAELVDLDLTHGPRSLRRAAFEAAGFVTRRMIEVDADTGAPHRRDGRR